MNREVWGRLAEIEGTCKEILNKVGEHEFLKIMASVFLDAERNRVSLDEHRKLISEQERVMRWMREQAFYKCKEDESLVKILETEIFPKIEQIIEERDTALSQAKDNLKAGESLRAHRTRKEQFDKQEIIHIASDCIERGKMKHHEIAQFIKSRGIAIDRSDKFRLNVIKELCRQKGREDLISGISKKD